LSWRAAAFKQKVEQTATDVERTAVGRP